METIIIRIIATLVVLGTFAYMANRTWGAIAYMIGIGLFAVYTTILIFLKGDSNHGRQ